jgi:hypothetical protein
MNNIEKDRLSLLLESHLWAYRSLIDEDRMGDFQEEIWQFLLRVGAYRKSLNIKDTDD